MSSNGPMVKVKVKVRVIAVALLSAYTTRDQEPVTTISEVAADWHERMIPQRILWPSIVRANKQLVPRCSTRTYHRPNQPH